MWMGGRRRPGETRPMTTYTIRSHNRTETATTIEGARAIAGRRAVEYCERRNETNGLDPSDEDDAAQAAYEQLQAVWCGPSSWTTDDGERCHGGYAVASEAHGDVAEGCAVIVSPV